MKTFNKLESFPTQSINKILLDIQWPQEMRDGARFCIIGAYSLDDDLLLVSPSLNILFNQDNKVRAAIHRETGEIYTQDDSLIDVMEMSTRFAGECLLEIAR